MEGDEHEDQQPFQPFRMFMDAQTSGARSVVSRADCR